MCQCISYNRPDLGGTEPEVVLDYAKYFPDTGSPKICVDPCIADVMERLWEAGVRTRGCCCGHNGQLGTAPTVYIEDPKSAVDAVRVLSEDERDWNVVFWA